MAKPEPKTKPAFRSPIPERYQDLACIVGLMLTIVFFFAKAVFTSNTLQAGDAISFTSFVPFLNAEHAVGEFPLWIPNIFSGMPSYGSLLVTGDRWFDLTVFAYMKIETIVKSLSANPDVFRIVFEYCVLGAGMYIYMRSRKVSRLVALFAAYAVVFSSFVISLVMMGHNTKVWALMCAPYLLLAIDKLVERFRWGYVVVLAIVMHMCIESTHVQMVFNIFLGLGVYLLYQLVVAAFKKEPVLPWLRVIGVVVVCGGLGVGMAADRYLSVREYNEYSIRGTGPLVHAERDHATEGGGLDYEYATNWSFSPEEVLTFVVPGYFGNGVLPYPYKGQTVYAHSYWGQMPFTDAPNYMGIIVLLLAFYGIATNWRDRRVQALTVVAGLALFVSFGHNLSVLYDLLFNYLPYFNKFRVPSMMLALVQIITPILAAMGLHTIVQRVRESDETKKKRLLWIAIGCAIWLVIGVIAQSGLKDSYLASVQESNQKGQSELPGEYVFGVAMGDWMRCAFLAALFFTGAWFATKGKMAAGAVVGAAIVLTVIDLMWVDVRRMEIVPKQAAAQQFQKTDVIDYMKRDSSLYRIYDVTGGPNMPAYWNLQHIVGYHAAKMRSYQDLLDVAGIGDGARLSQEFVSTASRAHGSTGGPIANALLWNLLNVKYIVSSTPPGPGYPIVFASKSQKIGVFLNPDVLPRAFFVDRIEVKPPLEILNALKQGQFDPRKVMYCEDDPHVSINAPDSTAHVTIDGYSPQTVSLTATASGNNVLLLSEVYYKPGWRVFVDGKETPVLKADYVLRGVVVPAGTHKIEFRFISSSFETGKTIALASNSLVILATLLVVGMEWRRRSARKEPA